MNKYTHVVHPFEMILKKESDIIILGSFPSVKSRENDFYYMHPQNRFWKILSKLYNVNFLDLTNEEKRKKLNDFHIALYDTVVSCDIINSSDVSIKNVEYLDIYSMMNQSKIKKIFCNGTKSYDLFIKKYKELENITFKLPSSSPANAKKSIDELVEEWKIIKER